MALSSTTQRQDFQGDGVTVTFAIPWAAVVSLSSELQAILRDETDADAITETTWTSPTNYSISGANLVAVSAPSATQKLILKRILPLTQTYDVSDAGAIQPLTLEQSLDRLAAQVQQLQEQLNRCVQWNPTEQFSGAPDVEPYNHGGEVIGLNDDGDEVRFYSPDELMDLAEGTISEQFSISLTNNQSSAADLTDVELDVTEWTSAWMLYEIKRDTSTTHVAAMGLCRLQYANGAWAFEQSLNVGDVAGTHGVVFSMTESSGVAQIQYTTTNMGGTGHSGTAKIKFLRFEA